MRIVSPKTTPGDVWNALTSQYGISGSYGEKLESLPGFKTEAVRIIESDLKYIEQSDLPRVPETDDLPLEEPTTPQHTITISKSDLPTWVQQYGKRVVIVPDLKWKYQNDALNDRTIKVRVKQAETGDDAGVVSKTVASQSTGNVRFNWSGVGALEWNLDTYESVTLEIYAWADGNNVWLKEATVDAGRGSYNTVQIGTKTVSPVVEIARITNIQSIALNFVDIHFSVFTEATDTAYFFIQIDHDLAGEGRKVESSGSNVYLGEKDISESCVVNDYIFIAGKTSNSDNPMVLHRILYRRAYFE